MRAAALTVGFCSKGGPREERKGREEKDRREERVRHLKAAVWAAEKLEAQPPSPRSHLDGAGRQESVGNNKGGRVVSWVRSDAAVAKQEKKIYSDENQVRKQQGLIDVSKCRRS